MKIEAYINMMADLRAENEELKEQAEAEINK